MIPKDMITKIAAEMKTQNITHIEKDLYLQGLLIELEKSEYFKENFTFKGGTCLTKAYFGYYRFSEDLDFTWIKQEEFQGKSEKTVRKILSKEITKLLEIFESSAKSLDLDFKPNKSDRHYIEFGASNRFATFKFWYSPTSTEQKTTFIKIQINFLEKLSHSPTKMQLMPITPQLEKYLALEYPIYSALATKATELYTYDLKEIAAEKARAILTRRGFKARDIVDLYYISKRGITIQTEKATIIKKTIFMLKYLKYAENLKNKKFPEKLDFGAETGLIITALPKGFDKFARKTLKELNKLAEWIRKSGIGM
ncbi:MAG TPA: nucleotidyl transferase AbiEii/AbiGii toxin family protein [archaeon]|nr:nucleotidyl transferase AbiEii/AbiGii toxin family protein [archaeon]